ncbi:unnamed protein product [Phytophthora fragariaefolia]|uniref:Unnamed protein product n=1 Tax=Phytophthora fragariaefolia TaxID=1490495 RepID=A0A9W6YGP7_9STRA|nr:unnamed protein product [Phytophthora fragariaefolia]
MNNEEPMTRRSSVQAWGVEVGTSSPTRGWRPEYWQPAECGVERLREVSAAPRCKICREAAEEKAADADEEAADAKVADKPQMKQAAGTKSAGTAAAEDEVATEEAQRRVHSP